MEEAEVTTSFEPLTAPGPLSREELQDQDDLELWIVRLPQQTSAEELSRCKLPVTEGRVTRSDRLELAAETYVPAGLHVLLPNRKGKKLKTVSLPLAGQVVVHQRLDVPPLDSAPAPMTSLLPQPPAVCRDRHPLLGVEYKKTLKRTSRALAISEALDSTLANSSPKKKKRSETVTLDSTDHNSKRKKKHKNGP